MSYCCDVMKHYLEYSCDDHDNPHECTDYVVAKFETNIGIPIRDGGSSYSKIDYCPWCGKHLDSWESKEVKVLMFLIGAAILVPIIGGIIAIGLLEVINA